MNMIVLKILTWGALFWFIQNIELVLIQLQRYLRMKKQESRVGKGAVMKEAEAGVMGPQAEECCQSETREHR